MEFKLVSDPSTPKDDRFILLGWYAHGLTGDQTNFWCCQTGFLNRAGHYQTLDGEMFRNITDLYWAQHPEPPKKEDSDE